MADPLSIIASSIAVIQAADAIISFCKGYVEAVQDAPSDVRRVLLEVTTLKSIFEQLKYFVEVANTDTSFMLLSIIDQDGPIHGCQRCITAIQDELTSETTDTLKEEPPKKHKHRLGRNTLSDLAGRIWGKGKGTVKQQEEPRRGMSDLKWPLKKGKALKLLEKITEYKATITLAISTENMWVLSSTVPMNTWNGD